MGDDRPSILAALLRIVLGMVAIAGGVRTIADHATWAADLERWGIPSPSVASYVIAGCEIVFGALLLVGLASRLAAIMLLALMIAGLLTAGRHDDIVYLVVPGVLAFFLLISAIAGGGRWALLDRIDPAPPRRLARD